MAKIRGIDFDFGGTTLTIPPLALGDLEVLQDRLAAFQANALDAQSVATVIDATHAALRRNYPELTRQQVAELIDVGNMADVLMCVMDVAGVRRKELEGKAAAASATTS